MYQFSYATEQTSAAPHPLHVRGFPCCNSLLSRRHWTRICHRKFMHAYLLSILFSFDLCMESIDLSQVVYLNEQTCFTTPYWCLCMKVPTAVPTIYFNNLCLQEKKNVTSLHIIFVWGSLHACSLCLPATSGGSGSSDLSGSIGFAHPSSSRVGALCLTLRSPPSRVSHSVAFSSRLLAPEIGYQSCLCSCIPPRNLVYCSDSRCCLTCPVFGGRRRGSVQTQDYREMA